MTLVPERAGKEPIVYTLDGGYFEENADQVDDEAVANLEPNFIASAMGHSLRLVKNDGILNVAHESKDSGVPERERPMYRSSNSSVGCNFHSTLWSRAQGSPTVSSFPPTYSHTHFPARQAHTQVTDRPILIPCHQDQNVRSEKPRCPGP